MLDARAEQERRLEELVNTSTQNLSVAQLDNMPHTRAILERGRQRDAEEMQQAAPPRDESMSDRIIRLAAQARQDRIDERVVPAGTWVSDWDGLNNGENATTDNTVRVVFDEADRDGGSDGDADSE